jgi:hypothetical protein
MNIKLDDKVLMDMIFKCLCRVLKNRKIYHRFRCFIGYGGMGSKNVYSHDLTTTIYSNMNSMQHYVAEAQNGDNPFYHTASTEDIFKVLTMVVGDDNKITKENCRDASKVQMRIMQCLNTLLHSCVERTVGGFAEIERIGQETFEMVCKNIYGDDFVDETEQNMPEDVKKMIDAQREYSNSMGGMLDPRMMPRDPRFLEFLKERGIIDNNGRRERPIRMMPPTEEALRNIEWYHPTDQDLGFEEDWREEDWEWEIIR